MKESKQRHEITLRKLVYELPGMDAVKVRPDVVYRATEVGPLTLDLYYPSDSDRCAPKPAVLFVSGFPDPGFEATVGCKFKEVEGYVSWGKLVASSGLVAVTYSNDEPTADLDRVVEYLRQNAASLEIDERRMAVWASSGNVPTALGLLMREGSIAFQCAVLCYGLTLDLDGASAIAQAAAHFGFAYPLADKSVENLPAELPLMLVRAGRDATPGLNQTLDAFIAAALRRNLPLTLVNHASGPHAFDILDDTEMSRETIRQILGFFLFHLLRHPPERAAGGALRSGILDARGAGG